MPLAASKAFSDPSAARRQRLLGSSLSSTRHAEVGQLEQKRQKQSND